jgi:hypothetical protein
LTFIKEYDIMEEIQEESPFGDVQEIVHSPTCWKEHGVCATKRLEELLTLLKMSKKKVDRDELIKILES